MSPTKRSHRGRAAELTPFKKTKRQVHAVPKPPLHLREEPEERVTMPMLQISTTTSTKLQFPKENLNLQPHHPIHSNMNVATLDISPPRQEESAPPPEESASSIVKDLITKALLLESTFSKTVDAFQKKAEAGCDSWGNKVKSTVDSFQKKAEAGCEACAKSVTITVQVRVSSSSRADGQKEAAAEVAADNNDPLLVISRLLNNTDVWVEHILPYVGPGHYLYVALVCRRFQALYRAYFATLKIPPRVRCDLQAKPTEAGPTTTFFRAVFASVSLTQYWYKNITRDELDLVRRYVCQLVTEYGNLPVLQWLRRHHCHLFPWSKACPAAAARAGRLELLQYIHESQCPWDERTCAYAAEKGHLDILKYAHERNCPWDYWTMCFAARSGHLEILAYAHQQGCPWNGHVCSLAAEKGHLEIVQFAHENGCPWDEWTCAFAAEKGHLEILKYAYQKKCPWNERTCEWAAQNGHLEVLKWLREKECSWDEKTCNSAAQNGHLEIAEWAHGNGCPWTQFRKGEDDAP